MQIHGIGQISISVSDVDRAVEFYRDILGIKFLFQVPGTPAMAFFDCDGTRLYIAQSENPDDATARLLSTSASIRLKGRGALEDTRRRVGNGAAHHSPN